MMTFNLQRSELAYSRRRKQFVAETLGHGEHQLSITVGERTKVTILDFGYDEHGRHECEITIHEEGIELDDVIRFIERDRRIEGKYDPPEPTPEEYQAMRASIERHGIQQPVVLDEFGNVIDGRIRRRLAEELGINCPAFTIKGLTAQQKLELAHELDSCRKHYSQSEKAEVVKRLLQRMPSQSDRSLARLAGVSPKTVGRYREQLVEGLVIQNRIQREGKDGKTYRLPRIATGSNRELVQALSIVKELPASANGKLFDISTANRRVKRHRLMSPPTPSTALLAGNETQIFHCGFQQLEKEIEITPGSVQLVLTDIPYGGDFLSQLDDLASLASRVLADGGVFASYVGTMWLPEVMRAFGKHLDWRWMIPSAWQGEGLRVSIPDFGTAFSHHKPVLIYSKGQGDRRHHFNDLLIDHPKEKDWHEWQQPLSEAEKLIVDFSQPGDLVIDPLGGGFTTAVACLHTGRKCISCDVDARAYQRGQQRISEELKKLPQHYSPSEENENPGA